MLPECSFRGEEVQTPRRPRWKCTHPKIARDVEFALVVEANCWECPYNTWDTTVLERCYEQNKAYRVTPQTFVERLQICDGCEQRAGNYCRLAGGCGLSAKLGKREFACPLELFPSKPEG